MASRPALVSRIDARRFEIRRNACQGRFAWLREVERDDLPGGAACAAFNHAPTRYKSCGQLAHDRRAAASRRLARARTSDSVGPTASPVTMRQFLRETGNRPHRRQSRRIRRARRRTRRVISKSRWTFLLHRRDFARSVRARLEDLDERTLRGPAPCPTRTWRSVEYGRSTCVTGSTDGLRPARSTPARRRRAWLSTGRNCAGQRRQSPGRYRAAQRTAQQSG